MNIDKFVDSFLATANAFDTTSFLKHWQKVAILDDPSVGRIFNGLSEIQEYFEDYFIGYNTQTELVKVESKSQNELYVEVIFTGTFPQRKIGGSFDFTFNDDKIIKAIADLIH